MKWVQTSAIVIFAAVTAVTAVVAEEKEPWGFQNIAVINLPTDRASIHRALDNKAVEIQFNTWTPQFEEALKSSLSLSPLSYRLFPARQTAMFVEVFSIAAEVDFAVRPKKGGLQIIIGEIRQEAATAKILNLPETTVPVPGIAELIRAGKYTTARHDLHALGKKKPGTAMLFKTRISLVDYLKSGRSGAPCPKISTITAKNESDIEALLLNAWCEKERKNTDTALYYAGLVKKLKRSGTFFNIAEALEETIVSGRILTADRLRQPIVAAAHSIAHMDIIQKLLPEITFIETVASNLIELGLATPLSKMLQEMMARDSSEKAAALEPILVDAYLTTGSIVSALDSATYFLTRRRPVWSTARLKRSQGLALLQTGDWKGATKSLETAKTMGAAWSIDDDLALFEARMRSDVPAEVLLQSLENFVSLELKLNNFQKTWLSRILAETRLKAGEELSVETRASVPDHTLFEIATALRAADKTALAHQIMSEIAAHKTGWSPLAKLILDIERMGKDAAEIKTITEQLR